MRMSKLVHSLLAGVVLVGALSGCATTETAADTSGTKVAPPSTPPPPPPPQSGMGGMGH
jgi:hypothetical protein